jgi:UDP-2-acetamido-3-amino-2,3-dideoxy-glucuronate N-acetyltransferase
MTISSKIACIGAGYWGKNLVRNFNELGALSWVCDADPHRRAQLAMEYPNTRLTDSFDQVLSDADVDGVAIATPAVTHADLVQRALLAGKDVFVEKPLSLSVEEAQKLVALASDRRLILMVGHLLWYHPAVLKLKQLVNDGDLGRIRYIYSNRLNLGKIRREENILWSFAPHDISVILGLVGEMPDAVLAQGGNYLHDQIADVTVSMLSFPSGVKAHIFVSWLHPFKEQKLIVVGDRQMAVFDDVASENKLVLYPHSITWRNHLPISAKAKAVVVPVQSIEPLKEECLHFLQCMQTRNVPRTDGAEGLRVLRVLQEGQSALQRQTLTAGAVDRPQSRYFIHESAFVDDEVEIGEGTTIWHVSHILKNSRIGRDCRIGQNVVVGPNVNIGNGVKIQNNVSVYEGVTLEDDVFCGPSMVFTNVYNPRSQIRRMDELRTTIVRRGATLGANCTIVCGVIIGRYAFIGAGAVVTKNVPDFALIVGNPGRIAGWMCSCGNRIVFNGADSPGICKSCQCRYIKEQLEVHPTS